VAALTAATLVTAGVLVYAIERQRLEDRAAAAADQELQEFEQLQRRGIDPSTSEPFASVEAMLRLFFQRNIPDGDEVLVGWFDDEVQLISPETDLVDDPAFLAAAEPLVTTGGTARLDVPGLGDLLVVAQPVRSDSGRDAGALLVVTRLDIARDELRDTMRTYAVVSGLALLLVSGLALAVTGRLLAPLRRLRETAEEINESDLTRRIPVSGNDDITALTRTVNTMLARLETGFADQRRFLDDAGHELRTPLTVLRGHLEVLDAGSPEDVRETRDLLLDEATRMSRLVDELILLAKTDRPDFVRVAPTDLAGLTEDLVAKCRGLGDRVWEADSVATGTVEIDAQRHTGRGDVVAVGSAYDGSRLRLWVRDTGPGLAPADRGRVFQRFARAGDDREHTGFGLGLSIVSAIALAHGGTATWEDPTEVGQPHGSRFVLSVPAARIRTETDPEQSNPGQTNPGPTQEDDTWPGS
jgi:signal transduction histidine kinase